MPSGFPKGTSVEVWHRRKEAWYAGEVYSEEPFIFGGQWCYRVTTRQVLVQDSTGQDVWQPVEEVETKTYFAIDTKQSGSGRKAGFA